MADDVTVFDCVKAVSASKDTSLLERDDFDSLYKAFIVNRALSYHQDSALAANMMNERPDVSPQLQFTFLLNTLRSRTRYSKWLKPSTSEDANIIAEYYQCSYRRALELVGLHTSEQLAHMRTRLEKGGLLKKKSR